MKILVIGDPHVTVREINDAERLIAGVETILSSHPVDAIWILGDLHHDHALVRIEVTEFWIGALQHLAANYAPVKVLAGNHDGSNDRSVKTTALRPYSFVKGVEVIDSARDFYSGWRAIPYQHTPEDFYNAAQGAVKGIICHQTFDGAYFENGFFAPDGIPMTHVHGVPLVISGHIHSRQNLKWDGGEVWYVGSPRWRTISDANEFKCVEIIDLDTKERQQFDTSQWCRAILSVETSDGEIRLPPGNWRPSDCDIFVTLKTTANNLDRLTDKIKGQYPNAAVRPVFVADASEATKVVISESEGLRVALERLLKKATLPNGSTPQSIWTLVVDRGLV